MPRAAAVRCVRLHCRRSSRPERCESLAKRRAAHHALYHHGKLILRGTAENLEVIRLDDESVGTFHVESPAEKANEVAAFQTDAALALKTLGYPKEVARRAVCAALERDAPHDLESLIKGALRRCGST